MSFIADLHIHSSYSIATSRDISPETIYKWAQLKGVTVLGTGDLTHPSWISELKEKLEPAGNGLFRLKKKYRGDRQRGPLIPAKVRSTSSSPPR